jgi:hypothetical protein
MPSVARRRPCEVSNLPREILDSPRAVVWNYETRAGKPTKVPYRADQPSIRAKVNEPRTWNPFSMALAAVEDQRADGPGVVLGDRLVGVDIDHCIDPATGEITESALTIVRELDSYTERSPSGTGLHILVKGDLPVGGRRINGVEMYADERYFTVTGAHLAGTPTEVHERTDALTRLHARLFATRPASPVAERPDVRVAVALDDEELLDRARNARNGGRFRALWEGDLSEYGGDESAADLALCNTLAFWTGCNAVQMDRLFQHSGLMREKWNSRRGNRTYGARTIERAIADCTQTYAPSAPEITIIESSAATAGDASDSREGRPVLGSEALVGLFGDLIHTLAPATEADPVALLGHALPMLGNMVGRGPHTRVGADAHYTNMNVLIVGPSSVGRKGMALAEARAVLGRVDPEWDQTRVSMGGLSTGEGLISWVRDAAGEEDCGVADKRLAQVETEFARVLRVARREGNTVSAVIRQAWDLGQLRVLTRTQPLTATDAHISILGHITPHELRAELKTADMANGFINRFVLLLVERHQCLPEGGEVDADQRDALVEEFQRVVAFAREVGPLTRTEAAREQWHAVYPDLTRERPGLVGAICHRAPAHVLRMACLYALAGRSSQIRVEDQAAALALWRYAEASTRQIFGARTGRRLSDYLLRQLNEEPNGLTRAEIYDRLGRNRDRDEISEALEHLREHGAADYVKEAAQAGKGRPTERWSAIKR